MHGFLRAVVLMGAASLQLFAVDLCLAQSQSYIPWPNKASGETLIATLDTFQKIGIKSPDVAKALSDRRNSLAIVFVPGIMGSALSDKSGRVLYGDLSDPSTLISRLELPARLIDEAAESDVEARLLRSLGPMDLYGDAVDEMSRWASDNKVKFLTCGYDWRRDIRAGARDLERCLNQGLDAKYRDIVLVAHSMGGLVSWVWATKHEQRQYSLNRRLLQLAVLGSPLTGSCEIVRMIQSGYIQPKRDDELQLRSDFKPLKHVKEKFVDAFTNGVSAQFTQGIRPLILTWPGALELSPRPSDVPDQISCVGVPAGDEKPAGTPGISYYNVEFWSLPAGRQMLRKGGGPDSYAIPPSLLSVLEKAKEFRSTFKAEQLQAPSWLYYSRVWMVPAEAGYKAPNISEVEQWTPAWGDGRVPYLSATNSPNSHVFSYRFGVESVHGNLPADPNFFDDYFGTRLPKALAAIWAVDMMSLAAENPEWVDAFAKLRPYGADTSQVRTAIEPTSVVGKESALLKTALAMTTDFNSLICTKRGECSSTYTEAKETVAAAPVTMTTLASLTHYSAVANSLGAGSSLYPYAEGNRGLALAKRLDWAAAAVSMQRAEISLQSISAQKPTPSPAEVAFSDVLQRNLGKSLMEAGQCKAAEQYLRATVDSWPYAREALSKRCNDVESGLQYCFDTSDYCRSK